MSRFPGPFRFVERKLCYIRTEPLLDDQRAVLFYCSDERNRYFTTVVQPWASGAVPHWMAVRVSYSLWDSLPMPPSAT